MTRVLAFNVRKEFTFEAAHFLTGLPDSHACSGMHGHSYRVVVDMIATELDVNGMAIDFDALESIRFGLDHTLLNADIDLPMGGKKTIFPRGKNPTAENIAKFIYEKVNDIIFRLEAVDDVTVTGVEVWESVTNMARYFAVDVPETEK